MDPSVGGRRSVAGLVRRPERGGEVLLEEVRVGRRRAGAIICQSPLFAAPRAARARILRWVYAIALYQDPGATLDDLREAVTTLEDTERIARRVLSGAHPLTAGIDTTLRNVRVVLRAREALLAKYLLYGASALAIAAFALVRRR